MIRLILAFLVLIINTSSVWAEDSCDRNCKLIDVFCSDIWKDHYFKHQNSFYLNKKVKIMEIYRREKSCSSGGDIAESEKCYVLFYKLDSEWVPVSISCIPRNDFIFRGYIEDIQKVKVKDKGGRIKTVEVITGQKRIRMEASEIYRFDEYDEYKDIVADGWDIYHSLDELKKEGYTILEIIDKKKKEKEQTK